MLNFALVRITLKLCSLDYSLPNHTSSDSQRSFHRLQCYEQNILPLQDNTDINSLETPLNTYLICLVEVGSVSHPCQDEIVCKCTHSRVPYFNAPIFLENKQQVGKIDEILGPITDYVSLQHSNTWT